jgi:hypothetical protein
VNVEDSHNFEVAGTNDLDDADVSLTCMRCFDFIQWFKVDPGEDGVGPMLADLIRSAEEHAEQAHR